jgi:2-polyprenyl-3-methyl-5-hydroxy-6-metoxy-1,4-benzoquinol methylase
MTQIAAARSPEERRDALVGKLFNAAIESLELLGVYLGDQLGLYRALAERGPLTPAELSDAAGIHERYAREWLEQQAASGILDLEGADGEGAARFVLPEGHDEALLDSNSLNYAAPFGQLLVSMARPIHDVMRVYREGGGLPFEAYGADLYEGQARFSRPLYLNLLGQEWLPAVPALHDRLQADPPARVADVACGGGMSSIAIARAYPKVHVDGIDFDQPSIDLANRNLAENPDVSGRVEFLCRDAADPGLAHRYDLVTIFEALHDMSYPVRALQAARGLLVDSGSVLVCDERTADRLEAPAGEVERFLYGASILHCLLVGMVGEGAAGTGTVMRAETVRRYADEAGFSGFEVLPIENDFYRFYRLTR